MNKDLVLYSIAMVLSSIVVYFGIVEARTGIFWQATVIAENIKDTWYNFVTHGINLLFFMTVWVGLGSMIAFVFHLVFDNDEESC